MFKIALIVVLQIAIMAHTVSRSLLLVTYYTNTEAYEKLCVNKKLPMLHCNGKCALAKKIKQEESKKDTSSSKTSSNLEILLMNQKASSPIHQVIQFFSLLQLLYPLTIGEPSAFNEIVYRPPSC